MTSKKSILPIVFFVLILYFLFSGLGKDPTLIPSPLIGKNIPEFQSKTLLDDTNITEKDLLGNYILLNVWGSWCYACTLEHNNLIDIYETNRISIYGLNYKDDKDSAIKWLKQRGNPYKKNIIDNKGDIGIDFGVYGAPETFLINSKGVIVHKHVGPIDKNYFKNIILPLLKNE